MNEALEIEGYNVQQIMLPEEHDADPHPRLLFQGYGIHAGESFTAWLPGGWCNITLEMDERITGPGCWYISTAGLKEVCPVGLWCQV